MRILESLNASGLGQLKKNQGILQKRTKNLSSGMRINSAADDAAGLAISEKMRGMIRGLNQASRNIQDGISYMDTADGYLSGIEAPPLERLRELAVQAANDTLSDSDREEIQKEVDQIQEHLQQMFRSAEFNTIKIFAQDVKRIKTPIPGLLPGDTVLRQFGLTVAAGKNDQLTFRLDDVPYSISLDPGNYTADQLVTTLNNKFQAAGTDVTVAFDGDSLVYSSPTKLLDSFGGSMIEINSPQAFTSVIYDNSKPGYIYAASILGLEDITDGVTITPTSNLLNFRVGSNGIYTNVSLTLADGNYTAQNLIDTLNTYFQNNNIDVTALLSGNCLKLQHNKCGAQYTIDQLSGTARSVILDRLNSYTFTETKYNGSSGVAAAITGYKPLAASGVKIVDGQNDTLRLNVSGTFYTLDIPAGTYTLDSIADQLNNLFASNNIKASAMPSGSLLRLEYADSDLGSIGTITGTAAYALFGQNFGMTISPGTYKMIEGNSTPVADKTATATGQTSLTNGVQIVAGYNDTLTFNLNGDAETITLAAGWYSSSSLLSAIQSSVSGMDVTVSYTANQQLVFKDKFAGGGHPLFPYNLDSFGGNALATLMTTTVPMNQSVSTAASPSRIVGAANVSNVTITANSNDALTVNVNGVNHSIVLAQGTYTQAQLVTEVNNKLSLEGIGTDIVAKANASYLELSSRTSGAATLLNSVSGNAVNTLFRYVYQYYSTVSPTAFSTSDTYIDGRMDIRSGIAIASGKNDILSFDLHDDGVVTRKTIKLDEGEYTADGLVAMINGKMQEQGILVTADSKIITTPQGGQKEVLSLTYSPGVDGYFAIDGVGGSASYTVFYPGPFAASYSGGVGIEFQVGAKSGDSFASGTQLLMNLEILGLTSLDYTSHEGASQAILNIDDAGQMVSFAHATVGAKRNGLEALFNSVTQTEENLQAAESRIRDTDMAKEMMEYVKAQMLTQASTTIMANANKQPELLLELLK